MIEVLHETQLTCSDEAQISDLLRASFPTDFDNRSYYQQRPHMRVIWRSGAIVAHVALFFRDIRLDHDLVTVAGIGDVACLPDYRHQGIATRLFTHVIAQAEASQADFLLLFGARGLYDRAGFQSKKNSYVCVDMVGAKTSEIASRDANFLMVRALKDRQWPDGSKVDFLGPLF